MRTKKLLAAMSFALMSVAAASPVLAGPIMFKVGDQLLEKVGHAAIKGEAFSDAFAFQLTSDQLVSGNLSTFGQKLGDWVADPKLDIKNVYLTSLSKPDLLPIELIAADVVKGVELWSLSNVLLLAGDWELHIEGQGGLKPTGKHANSYEVQLTGTNVVPEPQTLALSLLALCGAAAAGRSRKS